MRRAFIIMAFIAVLLIAGAVAIVVLPDWRSAALERLPKKWHIALAVARYRLAVDHDVVVTMPDGVQLKASLYRPAGATGRLPTVLVRLPYHRLKYSEGYNAGLMFARAGYAVLVQDLRGTGDSEGELLPWAHAADDMVATMDWISAQPWSDGAIGTYGCSALGETQLVSQGRAHPAHRAMIVGGAGGAVGSLGGRYSYFGLFEGGVFQLASGFGWFVDSGSKRPDAPPPRDFDHADVLRRLPIASLVDATRPFPNGYGDFLSTPLGDSKWAQWGYLGDDSRLQAPALVLNSWGDQTVADSLALAEHWRLADPAGTAGRQKVIIGPGRHCNYLEDAALGRFGELAISNAQQPYVEWYRRWFDYWLRGQGDALAELAPYTYFVLGENAWRTADQWPPKEAGIQRWMIGSQGHANRRDGDGWIDTKSRPSAPEDAFRYDPMNPVPSRGGPVCCTGNAADKPGPADQHDVEVRPDVLVYTSDLLKSDLRVAGPVRAHLNVSSDVRDTDLIARLVDVFPDGRAIGLQEGALRLRYRESFTKPQLMTAGKRYDVVVDMRSIAYLFRSGHRLRLQVTSSSFPRLERNLNTGEDNARETRAVVATTRIHHALDIDSWLELPVVADH